MSDDSPYIVDHSTEVGRQYRKLADQALAEGRLAQFLAASRWIMSELASTPLEFGESRYASPQGNLWYRCVIVRPILVDYAVHERAKMVFIQRFASVKS